ncbi:MAG TPA: hypothetical protein VEW28_08070 [Candidatus Kapabacteria bacterium]|nr:hypothetical protein [Candidatus Kapabacteria bacterium]
MTSRRSIMLSLVLGAFLSILALGTANAQVPRSISYQGLLMKNGTPVNAAANLKINIYDAAGTVLYTESFNQVQITNGIFNVAIGQANPLPGNLKFDQQYFLGVEVDNTGEVQPRTPFSAAPYALNAQTVGGVGVSTTPQPGMLFPLGSNGKFPASVLPQSTQALTTINRLPGDSTGNITIVGSGGVQVLTNGLTNTITIMDNDSNGAVQTVVAGPGLTGGGVGPTVTLQIANNGITPGMIGTGAVTGRTLDQNVPAQGLWQDQLGDLNIGINPSLSYFFSGNSQGGNIAIPHNIGLNMSNSNTWLVVQNFNGGINVLGTTNLTGPVNIIGNMNQTGNYTLNGNILVNGTPENVAGGPGVPAVTNFEVIDNGDLQVNGFSYLRGNTQIGTGATNATLNVNGVTTANGTITQTSQGGTNTLLNTQVNGTLSSTGNSTVGTNAGDVNTLGAGAGSNNTIGAAGTSTNLITGATNTMTATTSNTINGTTIVNGNTTVNGNEQVNGTFGSTGNSNVGTNPSDVNTIGSGASSNNTIGAAGTSTNLTQGANNTITATGTNTINGVTNINGNTAVVGTFTSSGNSTVGTGAGDVNTLGSGAASVNTVGNVGTSLNTITGSTNTITATTSNTINGPTTINGNTQINGTLGNTGNLSLGTASTTNTYGASGSANRFNGTSNFGTLPASNGNKIIADGAANTNAPAGPSGVPPGFNTPTDFEIIDNGDLQVTGWSSLNNLTANNVWINGSLNFAPAATFCVNTVQTNTLTYWCGGPVGAAINLATALAQGSLGTSAANTFLATNFNGNVGITGVTTHSGNIIQTSGTAQFLNTQVNGTLGSTGNVTLGTTSTTNTIGAAGATNTLVGATNNLNATNNNLNGTLNQNGNSNFTGGISTFNANNISLINGSNIVGNNTNTNISNIVNTQTQTVTIGSTPVQQTTLQATNSTGAPIVQTLAQVPGRIPVFLVQRLQLNPATPGPNGGASVTFNFGANGFDGTDALTVSYYARNGNQFGSIYIATQNAAAGTIQVESTNPNDNNTVQVSILRD